MDLPEFDAFLQACGSHGAFAGVRLPVVGAERLATRRTRLRQGEEERLTGEGLDPTERAQAVLAVFARICGDTDSGCVVTLELDLRCG